MTDFATCVQEDENYKRYRKILLTVKTALDLQKTEKEALFLHGQRKVRKLHELRVSPQLLLDALLGEISARSRLVELKSLVINQQELLSSAMSLCRKHLNAQYSAELGAMSSTVAGRSAVLDRIFAKGKDYLNRVDALGSQLDLCIKDIDAASYSLTNVREVMKMFLDKKDTV